MFYGEVYRNIACKENGWLSRGIYASNFWTKHAVLENMHFSRWYLSKRLRRQNRENGHRTTTVTLGAHVAHAHWGLISNLSPNSTLQLTAWASVRELLQLHFRNTMLTKAGDSHWCSVHGYYICKIMFVIACFLIQACVTPQWLLLVVRYGLGSFLSGCLIQLAIDNLTNVSLATRVTMLSLKQPICSCSVYCHIWNSRLKVTGYSNCSFIFMKNITFLFSVQEPVSTQIACWKYRSDII